MPDNEFFLPDEPIRAAVYARYSTDMQNERSIKDQIELCRSYAQREGLKIVTVFEDHAVSGASIQGRPGIQNLLAQAEERRFDVVLAESMSRIGRDQGDRASIRKHLHFHRIKLMTPSDGVVTALTDGIRAVIDSQYLEDLKLMIHRGMTGLIAKGQSAGGKAYGYRPLKKFDEDGEPIRGELEIVQEEAAIVRRIFEDYAKDVSPRAICRRLNAEFVKPPRGKLWSPSALIGSASRGTGMLRNPIYVGRIVWNKVHMVNDPNTGKRVSRPNPESERKTADIPELRIVPDELFEAVQAQLARRSHGNRTDNMGVHNRPKYLLSGLLKCGACGSGMCRMGADKSGKTRLRCSAHTNSGACSDPKTFYADEVEELVIDSLTKELSSPNLIKVYAERYIKSRIEQDTHETRRRTEIEARIAAIKKDNDRLLDLLLQGKGEQDTVDARMKAQGRERDELKQELSRLPVGSNVILHPTAIKHLADRLTGQSTNPFRLGRAKLEMTLHMLDDMGELAPIVRELIRSVTLYRDDDGRLVIYVEASLVPFLQDGTAAAPKTGMVPLVAEGRSGQSAQPKKRRLGGKLVAEDRYRRSTHLPEIRYSLRLFSRLLAA